MIPVVSRSFSVQPAVEEFPEQDVLFELLEELRPEVDECGPGRVSKSHGREGGIEFDEASFFFVLPVDHGVDEEQVVVGHDAGDGVGHGWCCCGCLSWLMWFG